jgi:putative peptide zinc metalloprotease protein
MERAAVSKALFSTLWYRVKDLTPRLRPHVRVDRQLYRGEVWYVLHDASRASFHRFTPIANLVIGWMDGRRSVDDIWQLACDELGDDAPTQDEVIGLLGQLHAADALQSDVPPDVLELFERGERSERQQRVGRVLSPLAIRISLFDPERLLTRSVQWVRPLFSWLGLTLWLAVVLPALGLAVMHWDGLTDNLLDSIFTPLNLVLIWCMFPLIKALHEAGHGYAAKVFGGEVHDMGVMFLVFTPVPYVDASAAWSFDSKYRRALVGLGGMLAEFFVAALACYVWVWAEPGAVRAVAHNILVISGVTTILFNANPLLRFDGYYVLSDLAELPNLRTRANKYVGHLAERYLLGRADAEPPATAPGEPAWFVSYAVAAFAYRVFIVVAILMWILDQFLLAGLVLGLTAAIGWFGVPLFRGLRHLLAGPTRRGGRTRALMGVGAALGALALLLLVVPWPLRTRAEGVVWLPDDAVVRSPAQGFVTRTAAVPGARVQPGDLLLEIEDLALETEAAVLEARVRELAARYRSQQERDWQASRVTLEALRYARRDLERSRERLAELEVRSALAGTFVLPRAADLPGRFVQKGDRLASVVDLDTIRVRAVVPQGDIDLVRRRTTDVRVRLAENLAETHLAQIRRIVPAASDRLPSAALSSLGGGEVPLDPTGGAGYRAAESHFEVVLELPAELPLVNAGGRVYVRFDHGTEPLGFQLYRRVRQLFLSRFHV